MPYPNGQLTPGEAAVFLEMSTSALRRTILEGYFPEPGWARIGRKKQRSFSKLWLDAAKRKLSGDDVQPEAFF